MSRCERWNTSYHPCPYPFTGPHCNQTFAASQAPHYAIARWIWIGLGSLVLIRLLYLLRFALELRSLVPRRFGAADRSVFLVTATVILFLVRSIDVEGASNIINYVVDEILILTCQNLLVTVLLVVVRGWLAALRTTTGRGEDAEGPQWRRFFVVSLFLLWGVQYCVFVPLAYTMGIPEGFNALNGGVYNGMWHGLAKLTTIGVILSYVSVGTYSGWRIISGLGRAASGGDASAGGRGADPNGASALAVARAKRTIFWWICGAQFCVLITSAFLFTRVGLHFGEIVVTSPPCSPAGAYFMPAHIVCLICIAVVSFLIGSRRDSVRAARSGGMGSPTAINGGRGSGGFGGGGGHGGGSSRRVKQSLASTDGELQRTSDPGLMESGGVATNPSNDSNNSNNNNNSLDSAAAGTLAPYVGDPAREHSWTPPDSNGDHRLQGVLRQAEPAYDWAPPPPSGGGEEGEVHRQAASH